MTDAEAMVRTAIIRGLATHYEQTGLQTSKAVDMLIENLMRAVFDGPVRWAVIRYARECYLDDVLVASTIEERLRNCTPLTSDWGEVGM